VTNTLIERKGARTALITTEGFRDALEIGNEGRYDIYDLGLVKPQPLVERRFRFGVPERMTASGDVLRPLDVSAVEELCRKLKAEGIESVAISLLHSFTNPRHELDVFEIVRDEIPDATISISHRSRPRCVSTSGLLPQWRMPTSSPLHPIIWNEFTTGLQEAGLDAPLNVMLSSGGMTTIETAHALPDPPGGIGAVRRRAGRRLLG
jgi:N-methylhydantoinase A